MGTKPRALVLTGYGINCDRETQFAFQQAGAQAERVHLNDLMGGGGKLMDFQILAFPGGFSFGDDIASGKVLASKVAVGLGDEVREFVEKGNLVIGICNGFQVLAKYGILPRIGGAPTGQTVTVTYNDSGRFEARWVKCRKASELCVFTRGIDLMDLPIAHGEGKVVAPLPVLLEMEIGDHVALRYVGEDGQPAGGKWPANPNGAMNDIAGICDSTGRVFGLMPHPERFLHATNHPHWTRRRDALRREGLSMPQNGEGRRIFDNAVAYFK